MFNALRNGVAVAVVAATAAMAMAGDKKLAVGDEAPSLEHVKWVKGAPVKSFESGQIYVLDFWATWCGPCVASIPHINKLQNEYRDQGVNVIGVAIWPNERMTPVSEFVKARGDGMNYRIAEDIDGKIAEAFMAAAGRNSIPTIMIVNREGRLSWIGHPNGLDKVLGEVVKGTFNTEKYLEQEAKANDLKQQAHMAFQAEDWDALVSTFDEMLAFDRETFAHASVQKYFVLLIEKRDTDKASKAGRDVLVWFGDEPQLLNMLAWGIVDPEGEIKDQDRDLDLALRAAKAANDATHGEAPEIVDTMARVYFLQGNVDKAISYQEQAVKMSEGEMREALEATLDEYQDAKRNL